MIYCPSRRTVRTGLVYGSTFISKLQTLKTVVKGMYQTWSISFSYA